MHPSSMRSMTQYVSKYLKGFDGTIIDVGSYNVNGSYKSLFSNCKYIGIDIRDGDNVDIVLKENKPWPFEDDSIDAIISGSCLEHVKDPKKVFNEIKRTLKPGSTFCITAPSAGPKHDYPNDYHRFTVESMTDLAELYGFQIIECYLNDEMPWRDCVLIAKKRKLIVSVCIPFIRKEKFERCASHLVNDKTFQDFEIIASEDKERIGCPKTLKKVVAKSNTELVCFLGDDTIIKEGLLKNAVNAMNKFKDGWGLVGFNDNYISGPNHATHWLGHKKLLNNVLDGEFFHTGYKHCYCDNELWERCNAVGRYIYEPNCVLYHDHPIVTRKDNWDEDYKRVYSEEYLEHDKELFRLRKANNWR